MNGLEICRRNDGREKGDEAESSCQVVKGKYIETRAHIHQNWAAVLHKGGHSCSRICWSVIWTSGKNRYSREYHYINMFQYSPTWFVSSFWMELLILEKTKCLRWFYMQFIFSFMGCTICVWVYVFVVWCVCMCERNTYLCQYLSAMICLQFSFFMCCIPVFGCMHVLYGMCVCMLIGMCFLPVWLLLSIISLISDFFSLYAAGCCNFMEISSEHHLVTIIDEKKIL